MKKDTMREVLISHIYNKMAKNNKIFFLSADFGAVALDKIRKDFPDRFKNVGIAEQNLINIATGLSLEGMIVYVYGISAFLSMRDFEQMRNLSLISQVKNLNVNIISVGAGFSYDLSGPSHHCIEDIAIMRVLPNFSIYSPSDCNLLKSFIERSILVKGPKYIRLDARPVKPIRDREESIEKGLNVFKKGRDIYIISTGAIYQKAVEISDMLKGYGISAGVMDVFKLKPFNNRNFLRAIQGIKGIVTIEEHLLAGGLGSIIAEVLADNNVSVPLKRFGINDKYCFAYGSREHLHRLYNLANEDIVKKIMEKIK
jgi:transketolase